MYIHISYMYMHIHVYMYVHIYVCMYAIYIHVIFRVSCTRITLAFGYTRTYEDSALYTNTV